jgi:hypothetical protein
LKKLGLEAQKFLKFEVGNSLNIHLRADWYRRVLGSPFLLTCVISCDFRSAQSTPIPTDARFKQVHKPNPAQSTPNPVYFRDTRTTNKQLNIVQLVNFSLVRI